MTSDRPAPTQQAAAGGVRVAIAAGPYDATIAAAHLPADPAAEVLRSTDAGAALRTLHWQRNYLFVATWRSAAGDLPVVVKQFRHDSPRARRARQRRGSKAARSWLVAHELARVGIATAEPVACVESRLPAGPAFYLTRLVEHDFELRYFLRARNAGEDGREFPGVDGDRLLRAVAELTRRLHEAGIWHRDLTSGNVLVRNPAGGNRARAGIAGGTAGLDSPHPLPPLHDWRGGGATEVDAGAAAPELILLDLNRARLGQRLSTWRRMRELSRMPVLRTADQALYLTAYWGRPPRAAERFAYLVTHRAFLLKNSTKRTLRAPFRNLWQRFRPRTAHTHIPAAPAGAAARDKAVWDALSDQPHQHAGGWEKLRVRVADAPAHLEQAWSVVRALPRVHRRYRELRAELYREPAPFPGIGVGVRPWADEVALLGEIDALGARHVLLRLHPWESNHDAEEALAQALQARGLEVAFALPQVRDLVKDLGRWRAALAELVPRFAPYGRRFQIGQAINRSKWGVWNPREYGALADIACEVIAGVPGAEAWGPAVIDFEYYQTIGALHLPRARFHLDGVSALLYVDRRGAPESTQLGLDTAGKVVLLKAIADTARRAAGRVAITEVNWPLREGPHSPAGRLVAVDEERQAQYAARYFLLAMATGLVERVYWWQLIARGYGLVAPEEAPAASSAGRIDGRLRRRPAFVALQTLERMLAGSVHIAKLDAASGAHLHLFREPGGGEVVAAWSSAGPIQVTLPRPVVGVVIADGSAPRGSESDGAAATLDAMPRFFRLQPAALAPR